MQQRWSGFYFSKSRRLWIKLIQPLRGLEIKLHTVKMFVNQKDTAISFLR